MTTDLDSKNIYLVILAGGSGTRLWPLSRKNFPKQFLKVGSTISLVRETAERLRSLVSWDRIFVVCGETHSQQMRNHFPELNPDQILLEPEAKNTAAAIAFAAQILKRKNREAILAVLPADHKIKEKEKNRFATLLCEAAQFAKKEKALITLGIQPTFPATGYGYILKGEKISLPSCKIFKVDRFQEKPDLKTADFYFKSKNYFWNSGIFIWTAEDYLKSYHQFLPDDAEILSQLSQLESYIKDPLSLEEGGVGRGNFAKIYSKLTSISVDYGILEKSNDVYVIEAGFEWDDVGSLTSLAKYFQKDSKNNALDGNAVLVDSKENLILSDEGVVACLGIENLIVIKNKETVLILPKDRAEEVKKILEELKDKRLEEYL